MRMVSRLAGPAWVVLLRVKSTVTSGPAAASPRRAARRSWSSSATAASGSMRGASAFGYVNSW
jgi:hypothetical protein